MTSTMRFDQWQNSLGQSYGTILQVKYAKAAGPTSSNAGYFSTTSTSPVSTGFSVSITPKFATSQLLVMMDIQHYVGGATAARGAQMWVYRDGINQSSGGYQNSATFYHESNSYEAYHTTSAKFLVSANSTNQTTFTLWTSLWNSGTVTIGGHDGQSSLVVMEIAQ